MTKVHSCNECNKQFENENDFNLHMSIHAGEKLFICIQCNKHFTHKTSLTRHIRTHAGEKPFTCSQCNKQFFLIIWTFNVFCFSFRCKHG